ncbi:MAG: FAD-dependent oxidoreductase [Myxococcales bacterium]|nr:FAD-dependent oxidoreductase [Myxococcales bacterium]MCB9644801.1 FAD-dependent oxidoreductase [Myxococcales bacterium]
MGIREVTILGGGLCGLMTAWKLQEAGVRTRILEAQPEVGGLAKSVTWKGFRFDIGPNLFMPRDPLLLDEIKSLMGGSYQVPLRQSRLWFKGRWISYPLTTRSLLEIPWPILAQATAEFASLQLRYRLQGEEGRERLAQGDARYGALLDQLLLSEQVHQIWQKPSSFLSPSWTTQSKPQERPAMERIASLVRQAFRVPTPYTRSLHFPSEGIGSIAKRLQARLLQAGAEIHTNAKVQRILAPHGEVQGVVFDDGERVRQVETEYLFSTIPLPSLFPLLDPLPPHSILERLVRLRHRSLLILSLLLERDEADTQRWFYFPAKQYPFFRASFAQPLPEQRQRQQHACLSVECMLPSDHPFHRATTEEILQRCLPGLQEARLVTPHQIIEASVHREIFAFPEGGQEDEEILRHLQSFLTGTRRLRAVGMHSAFRAWTLEQTFREALRAARGILDENYPRRPTKVRPALAASPSSSSES